MSNTPDYIIGTLESQPAVYVGTYHKYACGSLFGAWIDLSCFTDADDLLAACRELHKDEREPELMFQDFQGFPDCLYSESMGTERMQEILDYVNIDEDERDILEAYIDLNGKHGSIDELNTAAQEAFLCRLKPYMIKHNFFPGQEEEAFGQFLADSGYVNIPDDTPLSSYFDYKRYGRDMLIDTYEMTGEARYVFRRI